MTYIWWRVLETYDKSEKFIILISLDLLIIYFGGIIISYVFYGKYGKVK